MNVRRAVRDGGIIAGLIFAAYLFMVVAPVAQTFGFDSYAYWLVDGNDPYRLSVGALGAFTYTPPIARLFDPFGTIEWWTFLWIWLALAVGTLVWLGGRGIRVLWLLALPPVALELYHLNIHLLLAAAIVLGFRYPSTWAFVVLTKVTLGIGLLWFVVRQEWHSLLIALGTTAAIVAVSVLIDGRIWGEWLRFIVSTTEGQQVAQFEIGLPLFVRLPAAAALVAWGGLTDRRWTVPLAATLALPVLWLSGFAICAAILHEAIGTGRDTARMSPEA